jgi:alpha-ketoglutarate-dependent taurine dioxygenase
MPTKITFLKSVIRSDGCGDTHFADTVSAYDALPDDIKNRLEGLTASYSYLKHRTISSNGTVAGLTAVEVQAALKGTVHPVITVHPITGERNIYANPSHTMEIHGLSKPESDQMLTFLFDHVAKEDFLYNHVWKDDDFIMWDNRGIKAKCSH